MISHFLCAFILLDHFLWLSLQEQRGCLFSNKEQKYTELEEQLLLEQEENADVVLPWISTGTWGWSTVAQREPLFCTPCHATQAPSKHQPSCCIHDFALSPLHSGAAIKAPVIISVKGKLFSLLFFCSSLTDCWFFCPDDVGSRAQVILPVTHA